MERSSQYTSFISRKQPANAGSEHKQFTENAPLELRQRHMHIQNAFLFSTLKVKSKMANIVGDVTGLQ